MKPKTGAARCSGICFGGSLKQAAQCFKSPHVKETIQILHVDELRSMVRMGDKRLNTYSFIAIINYDNIRFASHVNSNS